MMVRSSPRKPGTSPLTLTLTLTLSLTLTLTLTLILTRYVADSWGYVACANGLFVVIPASRNGLWAWLLGLPFDKTITIHRWMGRLVFVEVTIHVAWYF